ncbi:MAG TPA: carboxypeptidase-like regulatory domain-containing protein [Terracidiphilus sp.]|nr:carboxypeptidase-like regulatory domain-containing protein [Terracidiphilus sp.]
MKALHWLSGLCVVCLCLSGCGSKYHPKKPDPTKGTVTGIVICEDTGKPARFATVTLTGVPAKDAKDQGPLPTLEIAETDLDGQFRMEAVEPGNYYAFATLEGYLDPERGIDFTGLEKIENDHDRNIEAIHEWKDHMVEVNVGVHRSSEVTLRVVRAAEIAGTVAFDDGSPAIGVHFQMLRKTATNGWTGVGLPLFGDWSISATSDSHGRYNLTNLPEGEYKVCALLPADDQDAASRVCLGNRFRSKDSASVKVHAGETANGTDIVIPLSGLHNVSGIVTAVADGHPLGRGKVLLLYADDREAARKTSLLDDGSFAFGFVPEDKYILQVSGAADADQKGDAQSKTNAARTYKDKEMSLVVLGNMEDVNVSVAAAPQDKTQKNKAGNPARAMEN